MSLRQEQGKGAALARGAGQSNFSAEQPRNFPADRQAKACAAILAAGAAVRLLEGLKDELLLLGRDANAGVGDGECDDRARMIEHFLARAPTFGNRSNPQDDIA